MQAQYKILLDLKSIEEKIYRLQREAEDLPIEIQKIDTALTSCRQKMSEAKSAQDHTEKKLRVAESDLKDREEALRKSLEKMMEVKSNDAYKAAMRETTNQKSEKGVYEECVIQLMTEADENKKATTLAETSFSAQEAVLSADKVRVEQERARVLQLMETQISARVTTMGQLSPEVADIYNRTLRKLRSVPIVVADSGRCSGCHILIRPQLFNEILGFKAIHKCQSCGRILVLPSSPLQQA